MGSSQSTCQVNQYYMANVKMGIHLKNPFLHNGVKSTYMSSQSILQGQSQNGYLIGKSVTSWWGQVNLHVKLIYITWPMSKWV